MALSVGRPRRGAIGEINVTPMADVMIVLLVIFMVATPVILHAPVRLPLAAHPTEEKGELLRLALRSDGVVLVEGVPLARSVSLADYVAARASATRSIRVLIQADRDSAYESLAPLLAACRLAGVTDVALGAEQRAGS
jgi:biopolymer transport protein ExbD